MQAAKAGHGRATLNPDTVLPVYSGDDSHVQAPGDRACVGHPGRLWARAEQQVPVWGSIFRQRMGGWVRLGHTGELGGVVGQTLAGLACVGGVFGVCSKSI